MELGLIIDALYALRQKRLELQREVDKLKGEEVSMRETILLMLDQAGLGKASGALATCGITTKIEPVVEDWDEVHNFIRTHNRFDLLQKRLSAPAWRDLRENGELVPGTVEQVVQDVSLTKSSRG